jgi:hypothetical protein
MPILERDREAQKKVHVPSRESTHLYGVITEKCLSSLRELVSRPEVWLAQCPCHSNESLPYRRRVESAKAEEQRMRIRTSQRASIDGENLNALGFRQLFRLSRRHFIL